MHGEQIAFTGAWKPGGGGASSVLRALIDSILIGIVGLSLELEWMCLEDLLVLSLGVFASTLDG